MRQKFLFILAMLLTAVTGAWADEWDVVYWQTQTKQSDWTALSAGSTTGRTLGSAGNTTYYYVTSNLSFTNSTAGGSGLTILGTVYLYIPSGKTLTCTGADASGQTGGGAGIELTLGNSLYLIGGGSLNATGGNAANGGNGSGGTNATGYNGDWTETGAGGNGGNGGGGAGAGIGTRGGNGGSGGTGGSGHRYDNGEQDDAQNGTDGTSGSAGETAGVMGMIYVYQTAAVTVSATGGAAGSSGGNGGQRGRGYAYDGYSYNVTVAGGGGGGAGGFGGAASNIGTGGPGGGGGGGGAGGAQDWKSSGVYDVTAPGGHGGQNANGTYAADGTEAATTGTATSQGWVTVEDGGFGDDWNPASGACTFGNGGSGGACGNASTSGSASTVTLDWTTQEDDWSLICLRTGTTRADWVHLASGSSMGKTLGAAGTTTYYYTAFDRTFTNSNAGGSGLTILGTVYLYIPSGKTITCTGANATAPTGGGAGIELAAGNTLYIIGSGRLVATGGNAANGGNGGAGGDADFSVESWVQSGAGGKGGDGGGGAGAGIGTCGGAGGAGGTGGASNQVYLNYKEPTGNVGGNGASGSTAAEMGTLYIYQLPAPTTEFHGGSGGTASGNGGNGGRHALYRQITGTDAYVTWSIGGGGGGGGGGFGGAASDIGTGGPGGGGGGGGASGSIQWKDGRITFYHAGALGGSPGTNVDGTLAGAGESTLMESDDQNLLARKYPESASFVDPEWQNGDNRAAGGNGGGRGAASVSGSANAVTAGWPTQGKGIEDAPFIVSSTDDWNEFADYVNGGYAFSGNFVKLGDDISVSAMAGSNDANSFQGTFDGDGQTLTFTKGTSAEPFAEEYCAPFRHVKNATIKNLHVAGTIYTSAKKAAGIVGESHGALTLTGCRSSIAINSSISGDSKDGTHGGLVSTLSGSGNTIIIEGCVFDGSFATTNGTTNCGGFIGWPVYNKPVISNSLMKPSSVDADMLINTFARWHSTYEPTITNCYYVATTNLPTNQGTEAAVLNITPANPDYDYGMVKAYKNGIWFDGNFYGTPATVTLADNADNNTAISSADGYVANVTLSGRTLYKDGAWNTLCLPFDVTIAGSPLDGATARALESASISGTTLTLTFGDAVTTLEAGTPYIIKWTADANYVDDNEHNIVSPVFSGVTIDADADGNYDTETASPAVTTDERVRFLGTYKSTAFDAEDKSILLMGGNNTLYYPQSGAGIGAQRAYFKIGSDGALLARRLTAFNIDFGDDEATGIISLSTDSKDSKDNAAWYSLDGRKLQGKPSRAGVYINNGIKIVIK